MKHHANHDHDYDIIGTRTIPDETAGLGLFARISPAEAEAEIVADFLRPPPEPPTIARLNGHGHGTAFAPGHFNLPPGGFCASCDGVLCHVAGQKRPQRWHTPECPVFTAGVGPTVRS